MTTLGFAQTPSSNTGLKQQTVPLTVKLDFLQFVFEFYEFSEFQKLIDFLAGCLDDVPHYHPDMPAMHGMKFYNSGGSARGMAFAWNNTDDEKGVMGKGWVSVPGSVLGVESGSSLLNTLRTLQSGWAIRVTRLDIAVDDYAKLIDDKTVMQAVDAGNYARCRYVDPRFPKRRGLPSDALGFTIYFGSPQSDRRTRFYNKSVESKGKIDSYRWETQFRDNQADIAFQQLMKIHDEELAATTMASLVTGSIEFVDRASGSQLDRMERLSWWQEFIDRVGGSLRFALARKPESLERKQNWIEHQVQTSLALLQIRMGRAFDSWIQQQLEAGKKRFKRNHESLATLARRERQAAFA